MSAQTVLDLSARRPSRRAGHRRTREGAVAPLTRKALIADFLAICQLDPQVEAVRAPAEPVTFELGGETVERRVDFEVTQDGASYLVDVATNEDLLAHPLRAAAIQGLVSQDGRPYTVETEQSIRAEPRLSTVRLIMACKRTVVTAGDRVRILHQLDECGTMRLVDCASGAINSLDGVAAVLALACEGLIAVDINRPILPETPVRRRRLPYSDPFAF